MLLKETWLTENKKQKYISLPKYQLTENLILHFDFYEKIK